MSLTYAKLKLVAKSLHDHGYDHLTNFAETKAKNDLVHYLEHHDVLESIYNMLEELDRQAQEEEE